MTGPSSLLGVNSQSSNTPNRSPPATLFDTLAAYFSHSPTPLYVNEHPSTDYDITSGTAAMSSSSHPPAHLEHPRPWPHLPPPHFGHGTSPDKLTSAEELLGLTEDATLEGMVLTTGVMKGRLRNVNEARVHRGSQSEKEDRAVGGRKMTAAEWKRQQDWVADILQGER